MIDSNSFSKNEIWFITGSQHLYGDETLKQVAKNSQAIVEGLQGADITPEQIVFKPVLTNPDDITKICLEANSSENCIGLIAWMHTFSPAKMWSQGLGLLKKPLLHLHTQFNRDIPWSEIDMDFMNLNQSAHGGREFGFMASRMGVERKVLVGHWSEASIQGKLATWIQAARGWADLQGAKFARFGDNMREVAVTEGNKVSAQIQFGFSVNGFGMGDLQKEVDAVSDAEVSELISLYQDAYTMAADLQVGGERHGSVRDAAQIEIGLRRFLEAGGFKGFTTTFENLHGLKQLPGLAVQRLMADGYGFGAEGDWKTAALLRAMKVMDADLELGTSFMEDYTYHFEPNNEQVLGAHMLEICSSIASDKPSLEVHPLGIGGKEDPARLVFNAPPGDAINASLIDLGGRFRLLVNEVETVAPDHDLPKLPVARALWKCKPDLSTAAACWIQAGGAHHTGFSQALNTEHMEDFARMAGIELAVIDGSTTPRDWQNQLRWSEVYYHLAKGF